MRQRRIFAAAVAAVLIAAGACSSDDTAGDASSTTAAGSASGAESSTTTAVAEKLTILVSNDDGYDTDNISALVEALRALPDTEVVVAAPATNQSGQGSNVTEGELTATEVTTKAGFPAFAVAGTPADSVNWALDGGIDVTPDLVVTGINVGQNLGSIGDNVSGTVGAARAAAARDIPALATSATDSEQIDLDQAVGFVTDWVQEHRSGLIAGEYRGDALLLENLNIPVCGQGELRGQIRVEMSTTGEGAYTKGEQDCTAQMDPPADDITGFNNGWVTLSSVTLVARPS